MLNRRQALAGLSKFLLASPFLPLVEEIRGSRDPMKDLFTVFDFAKMAKSKLDPVAWDYLAEGGKDEIALQDSRRAFNRIIIRPRMLTNVQHIDLSTNLLGHKLDYPIFICPAGGKKCFYPNGEEVVARASADSGAMMVTNGGIDKFLTSGKGPENWWQVTSGRLEFRNKNTMLNFVEKLEDNGASGICFTVDIMHVSHRERSIRHKFVRRWCESEVPRDADGNLIHQENDISWTTDIYPKRPFPTPTWDTIRRLRDLTELPIMIKGILTAEDTEKCVQAGMSAVVVSSHGARQLDHVGATVEALPECVEAASGKIPVLVDGGFRRGTDILKALALGATAVGIARPYLWGMACFGKVGVSRVLDLMRIELALDMGMSGISKISEIDRKLVRFRDWGDCRCSQEESF